MIKAFSLLKRKDWTLTIIGEKDRAIDILEELMSRPSVMSLFDLLYSKGWDPLRDHPRFKALLEKYEKVHYDI